MIEEIEMRERIAEIAVSGFVMNHTDGSSIAVWKGKEQPEEYADANDAHATLGKLRADAIMALPSPATDAGEDVAAYIRSLSPEHLATMMRVAAGRQDYPGADAGEVRKGWMVCPDCHGDSVHWPISQPGCQACGNDGGWENADEAPASEPSPTFADGIEAAARIADERAKARERLFNENGASINAAKSVEAEEIAAAIRGLAR